MNRNRTKTTSTAVAAIALAVGLGTTGCAATVSTSDAAVQSSSADSATGWHGMTTTLINHTGHSIDTLQETLYGRQETQLPNGQQTTFNGGHNTVTGWVTYPGGSKVTTFATNPAIGPVMAAIHVFPETGASGYTFDVHQTRTFTWEGHTFSVYRSGDTDSSKEIFFTVDS